MYIKTGLLLGVALWMFTSATGWAQDSDTTPPDQYQEEGPGYNDEPPPHMDDPGPDAYEPPDLPVAPDMPSTGGRVTTAPQRPSEPASIADRTPAGQDLVSIDFPEPTEIKDIIKAVSVWTGKNVILGKGVSGRVQMISPRRVTKEEAYQAFLSALNVSGLTTVETGKVIKILPSRVAVRGNLQIYEGATWAPRTDKMITQIIPLKYIEAKSIQRTLSRMVTSGNGLIAYEPTNTLIISDTGFKVRRVLNILELLDVQGQQPKIAMVPIKYADAKVITQKISEFLKASKDKNYKESYGGFRLSADERTNSVIIFGPPRTIQDVKTLVQKFDFPVEDPANQAAIRVRFLDYADAKKLAATLQSLAKTGAPTTRTRTIGQVPMPMNPLGQNQIAGPPTVADLGGDVKITADESSNALLITGSRTAYQSLNTLIRKLDSRRAQVYVEADILDVKVDNSFRMETSIFAGSGRPDGTKMSYGWQGQGLAPIIAATRTPTPSEATTAAAVGALGSNFTIGVLSGSEIDVPGLGRVSPGALITLLKQDGNSRVLLSSHILTSNNEVAKFLSGEKIFYESAAQSGIAGVGAIRDVKHEDVDLILEIKPNTNRTGRYVTMKIDIEANQGTINPQGLPDVNKRKSSQIVTLKNGQTAVISGLVRMSESESYQKIPLLGDIPILGWLFRNSTLGKTTQNLMIFITPHIVYGANDLAKIYERKVKERDELIFKAFGRKENDPFMAKLPSLESGQYKPDKYDELEDEERRRSQDELLKDMGYPDSVDRSTNARDGHAVPLPSSPSSSEYNGGDYRDSVPNYEEPGMGMMDENITPPPPPPMDDPPPPMDDPPPPMDDPPPPMNDGQ